MSVRGELVHDGDRCPVCYHALAEAELRRVRTPEGQDVLALCVRCQQPTIIQWQSEAE